MPRILPVILSGGSGTRLWPLSREHYPKQLIPMWQGQSSLQLTIERVRDAARFLPPLVIGNQEHRFILAEQLRQCGIPISAILLEPEGRNTLPALAVAAAYALEHLGPESLLLALPADHLVEDVDAFQASVDRAATVAAEGWITTFGMRPTAPETGYGYIRRDEALAGTHAYRIARFIEKPARSDAETYHASGNYDWNGGMFLFPPSLLQAELERLAPSLARQAGEAYRRRTQDLDFWRLDETAFRACPANSIDYAVMEHTDRAAVIPCAIGWRDIGCWQAVHAAAEADAAGNAAVGPALFEQCRNSYVHSEKAVVGMLGLDEVGVIVTEDAVLVLNLRQAQQVKPLLARLPEEQASVKRNHLRIHRPWGHYDILYAGPGAQVKAITVQPGQQLSLQKHLHRSEHWVVIEGLAQVTRGEERLEVRPNESLFIPKNTCHRLENPGTECLRLIEVQSGDYLGEDDIIRLEDHYNRV